MRIFCAVRHSNDPKRFYGALWSGNFYPALRELGHELVFTRSGEEALRLVQQREFAVVLLDVHMQGLDGFETAKRIRLREDSEYTPIIFLTAFETDRRQLEEAYTLGAVERLVGERVLDAEQRQAITEKIVDQSLLKYKTAMDAMREMGYVATGLGKSEFELNLLQVLLTPTRNDRITRPADLAALLMLEMGHLDHEEFWVICLDAKNQVQRLHRLYKGSVNSSVVRAGEIFQMPILLKSASIIVAHNHPSGTTQARQAARKTARPSARCRCGHRRGGIPVWPGVPSPGPAHPGGRGTAT